MSKATDEQVEAAAKAFEIDRYANPSSFKSNMRAALEAASSTPDGEADSRTWFELREPGCVPERKGPMPPTMVAGFLRELFEHRPQAYVTVITMGQDGPLLQDGPECLQMIDGRSMNVGRRAMENMRAAHGAHPAPVTAVSDDMIHVAVKAYREKTLPVYPIVPANHFEALHDAIQAALSCLSHNAGEIEAGGEVHELQQSVSALEEERQSLIATKREQIGRLTARAEASDKRIAELEATIRGLLRSEYESAEPGLTDCIDNTGTPYQSQYLADQIKLAEAVLKESRL